MANQKTIHNRRKFLEKYGSGPRSYFRREGGIVMGLVTILLVGAGAFCLSDSSLSVGYFFLLVFICLFISFVATYLAYHYMLTQARKTMAAFPDPEAAFHSSFETTNMDHSWNDASVYVPPTPPAPAATRP
ncbi:hypothetical protein BGZ88_005065 [Linnemannia elongata]|nr:hypothetical protein BGZ88_005065 [Linnemannia elongata]KAF9324888.1 hypothetical protein BGZ91_002683 [Linnemannia elongata]KAG0067352.1 hypothetical protein BGZ90_001059 [Linnemannia elongata]KAK5821106.1 hypothetical protein F5H01DRAFT_412244 [Linnemannia elongata]